MNNMIVGSIRTTVNPPLTSGIYEALLEKAERERDEALEALQQLQQPPQISAILAGKMAGNTQSEQFSKLERERERDEARDTVHGLRKQRAIARNFGDQMERERDEAIQERERWRMQAEEKWGMRRELEELLGVKDTQCDEQFAKGLAALRNLIQERDHYKQAIEEISVTIQDWLDSIVQEPSLDFIKAIKAWADKKLNNG